MFQKLTVKTIQILEINHDKSVNSGTNLEKNMDFYVFYQIFAFYEINHSKNYLPKNYEHE